jgi:hypothetical protein
MASAGQGAMYFARQMRHYSPCKDFARESRSRSLQCSFISRRFRFPLDTGVE